MEERIRHLDYGVVERRIYDDDGKLTDIRKEFPAKTVVTIPKQVKRHGLAGKGHDD